MKERTEADPLFNSENLIERIEREIGEELDRREITLKLKLSIAIGLIDKLIDSEYNHYDPENFSEEEKEVLRDAIDFFNHHKPAKDKRKNYLI